MATGNRTAISPRIPPSVSVVDVFRNLATGTWSAIGIQCPPAMKGKAVAHPTELTLAQCVFRVAANRRDAVRANCRQKDHAFVRGQPHEVAPKWPQKYLVEVVYNPYLFDDFVMLHNLRPIHRAAWVSFPIATAPGKVGPLVAAVYEDDAPAIGLPPLRVSAARLARMAWCKLPASERAATRGTSREAPIPNPTSLQVRDLLLSHEWSG